MKATEFTKYFEFSISSINKNDIDFDYDYFNYADENDNDFYIVTDDQCVFRPRIISNVETLTECFDSMLHDYIDEDIEQSGFIYHADENDGYYEQMLDYMRNNDEYNNTWVYDVVSCIVNPALIENDVKEEQR